MSRTSTNVITTGLLGTGVLAWALVGPKLTARPDLKVPLNPLGINGSPYGEVLAMAMQGPIDEHFNTAVYGRTFSSVQSASDLVSAASGRSFTDRFVGVLDSIEESLETRTNPMPTSDAHKFYLRRKVEDKLRFAYNLDRSHYGNYASLHFFLVEPVFSTRPELTPSAVQLADETIHYCLSREDDPRPALTAAAAASNVLEFMFNDQRAGQPRFTIDQMRPYLEFLDLSLARHEEIARRWDESNNWDLLSPLRINEYQERLHFVRKFREAATIAVERFETGTHATQAAH